MSHNDDLMVRRNERRNGKETRYGNVKRGGVRGRAGNETISILIILQIFWNVVQFYSKINCIHTPLSGGGAFDAIFPGKNLGLKIE